jgi:hypothetical protein
MQIRTHMYTRTRRRTNAHAHERTSKQFSLHAPTARAAACGRASALYRRWTPLHDAALSRHAAVAAALLAHGADVHAKTNAGCGGRSPLWATVGVRRAPSVMYR